MPASDCAGSEADPGAGAPPDSAFARSDSGGPSHLDPLDRAQQPRPSPWPVSALSRPPTPDHLHSPLPLPRPVSPTEPGPTSSDPSDSMASELAPLLTCPVCPPSSPLLFPTTLHCGHTVCANHVRSKPSPASRPLPRGLTPPPSEALNLVPSCPLPTCTPGAAAAAAAARLRPNIPPSSRVVYHPAPAAPVSSTLVKVPDPKLDVTIGKIISLIARARGPPEPESSARPYSTDAEDGSSDEDEERAEDRDENEEDETSSDVLQGGTGQPALPSSPAPTIRPVTRHTRRARDSDSLSPPQRPRRRRRLLSGDHPPHPASDSEHGRLSPRERFEKELSSELTCEICYMLLFQPVTTPCQHTFCAKCLQRSLDHSTSCPLCRQELPGFAYFQDHPYNKVLLAIILRAFPEMYEERGDAIESEERDSRLDTPIFVAQLSFPGMPTFLHLFEPRYRLMLRRCLETQPPCFGMIMPPRTAPTQGTSNTMDYGTMLEIRSVQMLPDGRSMVETWGTHRFRILEKGTLDGYLVGRIERVDDLSEEFEPEDVPLQAVLRSPPRSEGSSLPSWFTTSTGIGGLSSSVPTLRTSPPAPTRPPAPTNEQLMAKCHAFLDQLRQGTAPWVVQRLNNTYGPMPTDASDFSFWMALVLPIDEHEKAKMLPIKSPRLRLRLVAYWIDQLNSNWWFSSGCVIL